MKLSATCGMVASTAMLSAATAAAAQSSCIANCNAANAQCRQAGKNDTICLSAWHQCKVGCSTPAGPAKLQVTRPSANTVVIKTAAPASTHR